MKDEHLDSEAEFGRWSRPPRTTPPVIDRRLLPNGEIEEWERAATIPDDFIYDPEINAYYPPGEATVFDVEAWRREFDRDREERHRNPPKGPHLITRDMLLAAGALNVKPEGRKTKGEKARPLFDLIDEADASADEQSASDDES